MRYTAPQLEKLIHHARQLGFWDDVAHWENELRKLTNHENRNQEAR